MKANLSIIVFLNRSIEDARESKDVDRACELMLKLCELERRDRVKTGAYRFKSIR